MDIKRSHEFDIVMNKFIRENQTEFSGEELTFATNSSKITLTKMYKEMELKKEKVLIAISDNIELIGKVFKMSNEDMMHLENFDIANIGFLERFRFPVSIYKYIITIDEPLISGVKPNQVIVTNKELPFKDKIVISPEIFTKLKNLIPLLMGMTKDDMESFIDILDNGKGEIDGFLHFTQETSNNNTPVKQM